MRLKTEGGLFDKLDGVGESYEIWREMHQLTRYSHKEEKVLQAREIIISLIQRMSDCTICFSAALKHQHWTFSDDSLLFSEYFHSGQLEWLGNLDGLEWRYLRTTDALKNPTNPELFHFY